MPNWCQNTLEIRGDKSEILRLIEAAKNDEQPISLERICPTPQDLLGGGEWYDWRVEHWGTKWDLDFCERGDLVHITEGDGYTAGDAQQTDGQGDASLESNTWLRDVGGEALLATYFLTAWAPPIAGFSTIATSFPDLTFTLTFGEAGGGFAGRVRWLRGQMIEDIELPLEVVLGQGQMWF